MISLLKIGIPTVLSDELLDAVSRRSGLPKNINIDEEQTNFLEEDLLERCQYYLPDPVELSAEGARRGYLFLKDKLGI